MKTREALGLAIDALENVQSRTSNQREKQDGNARLRRKDSDP